MEERERNRAKERGPTGESSLIQFSCSASCGVSVMIGAVIAGLMLGNQAIVV